LGEKNELRPLFFPVLFSSLFFLRAMAEGKIAGEEGIGLEGVDEAEAVAAGVAGEDAVAGDVGEHALGAVGGDVGQPVVVILAARGAEIPERIQEVAGEQADADAQLQNEEVGFERARGVGLGE
jgi:hypothetical protein